MQLKTLRKQQQTQILHWLKTNTTPQQLSQTPDTLIYNKCKRALRLDISKTTFTRLITPFGFVRVSARLNTGLAKVYKFNNIISKPCDHCNGTGIIHN
jgi:Ribonuclease G/E